MNRAWMIAVASGLALTLGACSGGSGGSSSSSPEAEALGDQATVSTHLSHAEIESGNIPLEDCLELGGQIFSAGFNQLDGAGRPESTGTGAARGRREGSQRMNRLSGGDADSCAGCHNMPRAGGGGDNVANVFVLAQALPFVNFDGLEGDNFQDWDLDNVANERGTIGMWGAGFIELLAREMTASLHAQRDQAIAQAQTQASAVTVQLSAKGVNFGSLTANPDGSLVTTGLHGVDADLVIKPFHQKGVVVSLREFTNNAMNHHHGIQSSERFGDGVDADGDGKEDELLRGDVTATSLWQAGLQVPGRVLPDSPIALAAVQSGETLFNTPIAQGGIGCAGCHTPMLELDSPVFSEPNPYNPAGNLQLSEVGNPVEMDLTVYGDGPRPQRQPNGKVQIHAYTDLKRHDMGSENAEPLVQAGVGGSWFLTKKLWGFVSEPPYMHHGRATTITEAIQMHGGEGANSRAAFAALSASNKDAVIAFLKTFRLLEEDSETNETVAPFSGIIGEEPAVLNHVDQNLIEQGTLGAGALFDIGKRLFAANFNTLDGAGRPEATGTGASRPRREAPQNFNRLSGPDANSCAGCHNTPGTGGGGDNVANVFVLAQALPFVNFDGQEGDNFQDWDLDNVGNERNTLGMYGSGYIELLAREMSTELQALRDAGIAQAQQSGNPVGVALVTKGVNFGSLVASPNGSVDTTGVQGIDADLVLKPFHQKGAVISLREFTNNAMNHHHGMQTSERFGAGVDHDADGKADELTVGDVTAVTLFQALMRVPGRVLPADPARMAAVVKGEQLFNASIAQGGADCASCHTPSLPLNSAVFSEPNPFNPAGNLQPSQVAQPLLVDLTTNGPTPRLPAAANGSVNVPAYTDLKRWDMGPENAEPLVQAGIGTSMFLTKKLWGFASEPPYWHDGRSNTIDDAIRRHGGDGAASRDAYVALPEAQRKAIVEFLKTLQVVPENSPLVITQ